MAVIATQINLLFALEVIPLQRLPKKQPSNTATPYYLSIALFDPAQREELTKQEARYQKTRTVTPKVVRRGIVFDLDAKSPIANGPFFQRVFQREDYGHKGSVH